MGCGNVALSDHLPAYLALPDRVRVVAVADPTPARRELGRMQAGLAEADAHEDALSLLERDDLDIIDLCTPQHVRRDLAVRALEAGRHVLSEKPLATVPADARRMVDAARAANVRLGIVHNYLFFPEIRRALELIGAGEIGPVEVALLDWLGCSDNPGNAAYLPWWRHDPRAAGGGVLMDMLHIVYVAEALLGQPIERVSGWVHGRRDAAPVEDIALARFETEGAAALVNVGWGSGPGGFAASGPEGRIEVSYRDGGSGAFAPFERLEVHGRSGHRVERELPGDDPILCIVRDFADAVRDGRPPIASGEQGLHILEATRRRSARAAGSRRAARPRARRTPRPAPPPAASTADLASSRTTAPSARR